MRVTGREYGAVFRRKVYNLYNRLPYKTREVVSAASRMVPSEYILGREFRATNHELGSMEALSREELKSTQLQRLVSILVHALDTTEYYREAFRNLGMSKADVLDRPLDALGQLPLVEKALIRDRYHEFVSSEKDSIPCDLVSTGGTSGEPFYFHIDSRRSAREWAFMVDQWKRVGYRLGDRRATFRGWRIHGELFDDDWVTRERRFSSFQLTDEYFYKIWPKLHDYRPGFVHAYPSTAISICQFMERTHAKLPETIRAFLIGSENIYDGQKEYIEAVSGRRCFCWYGHSEKLILAGECEASSFYHAYPQYGYLEFINEEGMPAEPGEFAEIVGTGFMNTVVPFIRYRTGDFCTYLGERCPSCGRNYPIFEKVRGRWTQEVLYGKSGNPICMSAINVHSSHFFNVFRFQFCQERVGEAVLKVVPKHGFSREERQAIEREVNEKFSGNVVITCLTVDEIPLTQRGKYKFIDQRIQSAPPRAHA